MKTKTLWKAMSSGNPDKLIQIAYELFDELDFEFGCVDPKGMAKKRNELDKACDEAKGKS